MVNAGYMRATLRQICIGDILLSSLRISLLVGTLLNLINQGSYWLHGEGLHMGISFLTTLYLLVWLAIVQYVPG